MFWYNTHDYHECNNKATKYNTKTPVIGRMSWLRWDYSTQQLSYQGSSDGRAQIINSTIQCKVKTSHNLYNIQELSTHNIHVHVYCTLYMSGGRVVDMMNARLKSGFSEEDVMKIFTDLCQAVARLHHRTKPIIHRDLKVHSLHNTVHLQLPYCVHQFDSVWPAIGRGWFL